MVFHKKVKFPLDFRRRLCYTNQVLKSGCGAVGSALPWGGRGRKFKSCHSDQQKRNEPCVHSASAFLQRKNMKLCPKTAPAPMAQRGGAGFPEARMRALGVPGCGRKFKSWNADQTQKSPASLALTGFLLYSYKRRHALRNDTFSASTQMGVDVQGGFNVAVAEIFLHFFRLHAAVVQNACRAVA